MRDGRGFVRAAALNALASEPQEAGISRFFATEYDFAVRYSAERSALNADFARRVLDTHTARFSPEVHAAAQRAVTGSDADRDQFARTGYAAARERDQHNREADGKQAAAIVEADRQFVRGLGQTDPGPQVRAAAAWALRPGAGDSDLVEFFSCGWASAARLDLETHRTAAADREVAWRVVARRLVTEAQDAEKAALEASQEAAAQLRAAAARAWREVGDKTAAPRSAWADAGEIALKQAENWRAVAAAAQAATGPNWQAIAGPATTSQDQWQVEQQTAREQAAYWTALLQQAESGEQRMTK
ncbi:hypothetical protein [Amycolatopsis minnesotensis]|uniref:hypothetical protein n=1 Tax=Amycolatopsis minnesotensis TaxID=337894 RepID=UPI0031D6B4D2